MTTIAATLKDIACDRQGTHGGGWKIQLNTKVQCFHQPIIYKKPFYVGMCGDLDNFSDTFSFFLDPTQWKKPPSGKGTEGLVLTADGKLFRFINPAQWLQVQQNYYAIGSGAPYALTAMSLGKNSKDAVKAAMKFDPGTGMGIKYYSIDK